MQESPNHGWASNKNRGLGMEFVHIGLPEARDCNILQHDLRVQNDFVSKLIGHKSKVKPLKIS